MIAYRIEHSFPFRQLLFSLFRCLSKNALVMRACTLKLILTLLSDFDKSRYCRRTISFAGSLSLWFSLVHFKGHVSPLKSTNEVLRMFCNEISTVRVLPCDLFISFILRFILLKAPNFC